MNPSSPKLRSIDSRRLTGPSVLSHRPGAVLDVAVDDQVPPSDREKLFGAAAEAWRRHARRVLDAVGWDDEECTHRVYPNGLSLALSAPVDALYAATEVNEWAWRCAEGDLAAEPPDDAAWRAELGRLTAAIEAERNPALLELRDAAAARGVRFLSDDDHVSLGAGSGSCTWPVSETPRPAEVDWQALHDVPTALVTGTNGKTTTVRLLAAMARAAGRVAGSCSTEGVSVDGELVERGDYSGPGGTRAVLRHPRVEIAILETARGGLQRRGLGTTHADVALITNIAADHLGEFGVPDLAALAEIKAVVGTVSDRLAILHEDPHLQPAAARRPAATVLRFSLESSTADQLEAGCGIAVAVENDVLVRRAPDGPAEGILPAEEVAVALGGAARHNLANALGAVAVATVLGLPLDAVRAALRSFGTEPGDNPGRLNRFELGGVQAIVDFAHNPHGVAALLEVARALRPRRLLVILGQAGDRDDDSIRGLAHEVARAEPDRVILKSMREYLRGRAEGEVVRLLEQTLRASGVPARRIVEIEGELEAIRAALEWSRPGDLLLLLSHAEQEETLRLLERCRAAGWHPGERLP